MDIELIKELIEDWRDGKLSSYSSMVALDMIVNPEEPSKEAIEWGRNQIKEYNKGKYDYVNGEGYWEISGEKFVEEEKR